MRSLVLDFDGVLHSYTSGWQGADTVGDEPVPGAMAFLEAAVQEFDVYIFSSRSDQKFGIHAMRTWMIHHFGVELVAKLYFASAKPPAFLTIDDRAICFDGTWPNVKKLHDFKPWWAHRSADEVKESSHDDLVFEPEVPATGKVSFGVGMGTTKSVRRSCAIHGDQGEQSLSVIRGPIDIRFFCIECYVTLLELHCCELDENQEDDDATES